MNSKHEIKIAALEKTIAFPAETRLYLGDPRLIAWPDFFNYWFGIRPITRR